MLLLRILLCVCLFVELTSFAEDSSLGADGESPFVHPAWMGLTPVVSPKEDADLIRRYQDAEQAMSLGRKGFWVGVGGLAGSVLFDRMNLRVARTFSYGLLGAGWATWLGSYGESRSILTKFKSPHAHKTKKPFAGASTQGAIGEASNVHLIPDGAYVHPLYNDVNGGTDKLLTASAKVGVLRTFDDNDTGVESVAYWRLLTPSFKTQFEEDDLPKPVGVFADWSEWKNSVSNEVSIFGLDLRNQLTIGYSDISNKGGKELHQDIHRLTGNSLEHLEYDHQPEGRFFSVAAESGIVSSLCVAPFPCADTLISMQAARSKMMSEAGMQFNLYQDIVPEWWEQALEVRVVRQLGSQVYSGIKPWRYEVAVGVRVLRYITPTVKYVSSYLVGDDIGQTYFDLLHYNWQF